MYHETDNRITTIENLVPSLEEINFQLTKTAIAEGEIQSLTFSASLEKISTSMIQEQIQIMPFFIKPIVIETSQDLHHSGKNIQKETKQTTRPKAITHRQTNKLRSIIQQDKKEKKLVNITKRNLADLPTASTFFNCSPSKCSSIMNQKAPKYHSILQKSLNSTKKQNKPRKSSFLVKANDLIKYFPYLQKMPKRKNTSGIRNIDLVNSNMLNNNKQDTLKSDIKVQAPKTRRFSMRARVLSKIK